MVFGVADQPIHYSKDDPVGTTSIQPRDDQSDSVTLGGHPLHYYKYKYYLGFYLWSQLFTYQNSGPGLVVAKHDWDVCKHDEIAAQYCHHVTSALAIQLVLNWPLQQNVSPCYELPTILNTSVTLFLKSWWWWLGMQILYFFGTPTLTLGLENLGLRTPDSGRKKTTPTLGSKSDSHTWL